ncbi:MAG: ATP-binding protein, partial [Verrucomicrobiota bacterium]
HQLPPVSLHQISRSVSDPVGWVGRAAGFLVIDEVQKVPELFPAIKMSVDRNRRPGRFLLTGSANVLLLPQVSESLAGRMEICTLWPLSQGELAATKETLIDRLFGGEDFGPGPAAPMEPAMAERLVRGGFPEVLGRPEAARREAWFDAYVTTLLQRDVRDLANIDGITAMPRLLMLLAGRLGGLLNIAELTRSLGVPHSTLTRYLSLLELVFLVRRVPAWSANLGKRLVKSPKIYLSDTGLAARLGGVTAERLTRDPGAAGPLLENFVAMELLKQTGWSRIRPSLYHYRTQAGVEVDFLLEAPGGQVAAVEVKSAARVQERDFAPLRALAGDLGDRMAAGVVLYRGEQTVAFGPRLTALPLQELWKGS